MRASALLIVFAICSQAAAANERPNILLIMADDVGCDAIGCYGGQSYKTPRIDALAKGGTRYRYCYSMPVCHPTRVCLLTGRYPFKLGHPRWGSFPRKAERQTFARSLKRSGYTTAIAGKWQIAMLGKDLKHPNRLGFDQYCLFGWHEGPRYFQPLIWQNGKRRANVKDQYGPTAYCDFLIKFFEQNRDRPFMAFYSMALCHDVTDDLKKPVPFGPNGRYETFKEMMENMDRHVGMLVDALDRLKLRKKTLILFTCDNGTAKRSILTAKDKTYTRVPVFSIRNGVRVQGGKGNLSDDGTNVPLIANWPGRVPAGKVRDDLVDVSDFYPTMAELGKADVPAKPSIDGRSFAASLFGGASKRKWAFAEGRGKYWVRTQKWKLYKNGRLFDVGSDPRERSFVTMDTEASAQAREFLTGVSKQLKWRKKTVRRNKRKRSSANDKKTPL